MDQITPFQSYLSPDQELKGICAKILNLFAALKLFYLYKIPKVIFMFGGGPGDHLLVSSVLRKYANSQFTNRIWMTSRFPELFTDQPTNVSVVPETWRINKIAERFSISIINLAYCKNVPGEDRHSKSPGHIMQIIARNIGYSGHFEIRPSFSNHSLPISKHSTPKKYVVIQSGNSGASTPMQTKSWNFSRFQEVVSILSHDNTIVQLGTLDDPPLTGVFDLRGKTTLLEAAQVIARADFFIGLVGFLMHLARALETRSIVIYGGREHPNESGYPCNENLYYPAPCSPCWLLNNCPYGRACMNEIRVVDVIQAVKRLMPRLKDPFETSFVSIDPKE